MVAWLESMADDAVGGGAGPRFGEHEALWLETRTRLGQGELLADHLL